MFRITKHSHRYCVLCGDVTTNEFFCSKSCKTKYYNKYIVDIEERICEFCGKEFRCINKEDEYCSIECNYEDLKSKYVNSSQLNSMTPISPIDLSILKELEKDIKIINENNKVYSLRGRCVICGKKIKKKGHSASTSSPSVCSIRCLNVYRKLPKIIKRRCICGNVYNVSLYDLDYNLNLTCSRKCYNYVNKNKLILYDKVCENCKRNFKTYIESDKFCSVTCENIGKNVRNRRKYVYKASLNKLRSIK